MSLLSSNLSLGLTPPLLPPSLRVHSSLRLRDEHLAPYSFHSHGRIFIPTNSRNAVIAQLRELVSPPRYIFLSSRHRETSLPTISFPELTSVPNLETKLQPFLISDLVTTFRLSLSSTCKIRSRDSIETLRLTKFANFYPEIKLLSSPDSILFHGRLLFYYLNSNGNFSKSATLNRSQLQRGKNKKRKVSLLPEANFKTLKGR